MRCRWGDRPAHDEYIARFPASVAELNTALAEVDSHLAAEFAAKARPLEPGASADRRASGGRASVKARSTRAGPPVRHRGSCNRAAA